MVCRFLAKCRSMRAAFVGIWNFKQFDTVKDMPEYLPYPITRLEIVEKCVGYKHV